MNPKDLQYLNKVDDASQYAVKRCEQGAFMFHRTTSQGSEVMNAANLEVRHKVAVCPINACILLTNTESRRYERQKKSAWAQTNDLTPRRDKEYKEVFDGVNYREFSIVVVERDQSWECSVKRLNTLARKHTVSLPKEPTRGSYFGKCTCGLVTRDAVPCEPYRRIESTKYYAVLVDKEAVAGAISAGGDIIMLYEHGGNQGRLRGR
jgi:hypothetical protein